jgi:hypothetical protein
LLLLLLVMVVVMMSCCHFVFRNILGQQKESREQDTVVCQIYDF